MSCRCLLFGGVPLGLRATKSGDEGGLRKGFDSVRHDELDGGRASSQKEGPSVLGSDPVREAPANDDLVVSHTVNSTGDGERGDSTSETGVY